MGSRACSGLGKTDNLVMNTRQTTVLTRQFHCEQVCAKTQLGCPWKGARCDLLCERRKLVYNFFFKMLNLANECQYFRVVFVVVFFCFVFVRSGQEQSQGTDIVKR